MKTYILPALYMLIFTSAIAQTGEKNFIDQPYIEVSGTAELKLIPDMIYLKIVLSETDTKGKISLESLEKRMKKNLAEIGIDITKDLTVDDLSSTYTRYFLKEKEASASREYVLLVHDATTAGKVVKTLGEENISNISVLKIDHSQITQKQFDLRLAAVKAAKDKAEAMAAALGQEIGKAIYIEENRSFLPVMQTNVSGMRSSRSGEDSIPDPGLSFNTMDLYSGVTVRFILK
jgi:uncharacterized protein